MDKKEIVKFVKDMVDNAFFSGMKYTRAMSNLFAGIITIFFLWLLILSILVFKLFN